MKRSTLLAAIGRGRRQVLETDSDLSLTSCVSAVAMDMMVMWACYLGHSAVIKGTCQRVDFVIRQDNPRFPTIRAI
jgi:hypothetical protein